MLTELVRRAAADAPTRPAVISGDASISYGELLGRSDALAQGLHARSLERFACRVGDVGELLALLSASASTGAEACIYPDTLDDPGIAEYAAMFGHDSLVTDQHFSIRGLDVIGMEQLSGSGERITAPDRAPVLILTTGTTGRSRAARHEWSRLIASVRRSHDRPGTRWLLVYNLHQFAAIQVILHVLVNQDTLVVPQSRRPVDVVETVRRHQVTHVSGTPTFWRLLLAAVDERSIAALPIRQITLSGESVPDSLLDELRRLFPAARFSQIYAATEFGTAISVRDGRAGLPASVLARDERSAVRFQIRDGQLYIRSAGGMSGYWGEDDLDLKWRPTGDLVELRDDRIQFLGRVSDSINVGGVKVHPLVVEERVAGVPGVEVARAYARSNPITGEIVALDVVASHNVDREQLERAIRTACEALPPAARPRRVKFVPELEVRGQKIARSRAQAT